MLRAVGLVVGEVAIIVTAAVIGMVLVGLAERHLKKVVRSEALTAQIENGRRTIRLLILIGAFVSVLAVLAWSFWLIWRGIHPLDHSLEIVRRIPPDFWWNLARGAGLTVLAVIAAVIVSRWLRRGCGAAGNRTKSWGHVQANDVAIERFFKGLAAALTNTVWLSVVVFAAYQLRLQPAAIDILVVAVTIYLIVAVGLIVIRATAVVVDTLDAFSAKYAQQTSWFRYYDHLRPLVPMLRRCLEYALWIGVASLVVAQLAWLSSLASYGPGLIQAIGVFFLARVAVELSRLLIDQAMLGDEGLDDLERKRRLTIAPLFKTVVHHAIMFAAIVLMLGAVGMNPLPFLAGAGILGLVIGFGAQPLINDVVSGFFILFENTFLVGDIVRTDQTYGSVEAIDFRTTRIRDRNGNLHIVRNGDLNHVINYSKDYTFAAVEITVAYGADLDRALEVIQAAGSAIAEDPLVRGEIEIRGVTGLDRHGIELRAVMKVAPGEHFTVAAAWRMAIAKGLADAGVPMGEQRVRVDLPSSDGSGG